MEVEARHLKLLAFNSMPNRLQPVQMREGKDTANVLLSLIEPMKIEVSPLSRCYFQFEVYAFNGGEAKKLLTKLLATSKQVFSPHAQSLSRLNRYS